MVVSPTPGGWRPEPEEGDLVLIPEDPASLPTGLDAFRQVGEIWLGKYPLTNLQYARFIAAGGYQERLWWTEEGWAWRTGRYDSSAPGYLKDWLKERPPEKRDQPFLWEDRRWNSPWQPVVGVTWFEALAYCTRLTEQVRAIRLRLGVWRDGKPTAPAPEPETVAVRLPAEREWQEAAGGQGEYPWGDTFDPTRLNCTDAWAGRDLSETKDWSEWLKSESRQEASTTAVTTFPQGRSKYGVWDLSGNVWEWMANPYEPGGDAIALRGGSWYDIQWFTRVSSRVSSHPGDFLDTLGFRVVVAPV